ncbi:neuropeptide-like protein C4orf48 homolog [Protobothrops mucrosquamatus]|uniref:neuropeptide-like protein C4orf48 homolog n=1 Tax=Protobothrops mucrosquamatus TaxID=103944 RepID=UPI000775A78B|nr:neuropeptide-like protein C4orf48 homolog [Protobothrops mucrosquamatus]
MAGPAYVRLLLSGRCSAKAAPEGMQKRKEEGFTSKMLTVYTKKMILLAPLLLMMGLSSTKAATAEEESGTAIPAESRPCVDCHAFEFMQRALQDLKKTAYNLDSRTETLLFKVEKRTLCDCLAANGLN